MRPMDKSLQNVDKIAFVVDVLLVRNGRKLGAIRPDEDGYYTIPLAVLGTPTDNRTYYEVDEFVGQMTSPTSFINRCLTDGKLFGEYGHPMISLLPSDQQLPRLMQIDEKQVSHHIKKIWTGEKLESGGRIIYGLIKPKGPYGAHLRDSLDDSCVNTSFSLRSIAVSTESGGLIRRKIRNLVTFDFVNAGGYNEASKRYAPATETFVNLPLHAAMVRNADAAMEHVSDTELNEIFGAKVVTIGHNRTTFHEKKNTLRDQDGVLRSIFTSLLGQPIKG
jgi:hypothetical protein